MNCVIYARVSTEDQAELSIPAQIQAMREFAKRRDLVVVDEFVEPGVSGRSLRDRVALQAMLDRCAIEPRVDYVVVHKIDRLARNMRDHVNIRFALQQHTIKLASVVENVDDSISGQLLENIMASIAQFYSGNLAEEVKKGMRMKVERGGWPFQPPRGYRVVRDATGASHIEFDDDAEAVRFAFEQYATNRYSYGRLRALLAARGFTSRNGKTIPQSGIERLLKNPFYAGRVRWAGVEHRGTHTALVTDELFETVQSIIATRPKDNGEKGRLRFLLRGIAVCGECGGKLTAERHQRWFYYRCIRRSLAPEACGAKFSNGSVAEAAVLATLTGLRLSNDLKTRIMEAVERLVADRSRERDRRLASWRMRRTKAGERDVRLAEALGEGELSMSAYRIAVRKVRVELATAESAIRDLEADPSRIRDRVARVLSFAGSLADLHEKLDEQGRFRLFRVVFARIVIRRGTVVDFELRRPLDQLFAQKASATNNDSDLVAALGEPSEADSFEGTGECAIVV